jgi:Gas vesicle protein K
MARVKRTAARGGPTKRTPRRRAATKRGGRGVALEVREVDALRHELARRAETLADAPRWNADPDDVKRSVARLVLTLVEFLRQLLERQAIRRMESRTLDPDELERVGVALMRLEQTIAEIARTFGLDPAELNLELGPLGRLL